MWRIFGRVCAPPAHAASWVARRARRCGAFIGGGEMCPEFALCVQRRPARTARAGGRRSLDASHRQPHGNAVAGVPGGDGFRPGAAVARVGGGEMCPDFLLCVQRRPARTARAGGRRFLDASHRQPHGDAVAGVPGGDGFRPGDAVARVAGGEMCPDIALCVQRRPARTARAGGRRSLDASHRQPHGDAVAGVPGGDGFRPGDAVARVGGGDTANLCAVYAAAASAHCEGLRPPLSRSRQPAAVRRCGGWCRAGGWVPS